MYRDEFERAYCGNCKFECSKENRCLPYDLCEVRPSTFYADGIAKVINAMADLSRLCRNGVVKVDHIEMFPKENELYMVIRDFESFYSIAEMFELTPTDSGEYIFYDFSGVRVRCYKED